MKLKEPQAASGPEFDFLRPPVSLNQFVQQMGITTITAWRFRKAGKLKTVNICGRLYVPAEEIANFNRRAAAGEFSREHKTPGPRGGKRSKLAKGEHRAGAAMRRAA
jgi:hypothetical protein